MSMHWEKVLTDPLGFVGYALFLVFGVVTIVVKQRKPHSRWVVPGGFALAVVCAVGGLAIAYHREPVAPIAPTVVSAPTPSMKIDKVDQKVESGNAIAGVQGDVTINSAPPPKASKRKP